MTNGIFKSTSEWGYARVTTFMSTQSPTDFEWSVRLVRGGNFGVGIASQLTRENELIHTYDPNAILYRSFRGHKPDVKIGTDRIYPDVTEHKTGDVIRFRFQSHVKKLLIDLVRICKSL